MDDSSRSSPVDASDEVTPAEVLGAVVEDVSTPEVVSVVEDVLAVEEVSATEVIVLASVIDGSSYSGTSGEKHPVEQHKHPAASHPRFMAQA